MYFDKATGKYLARIRTGNGTRKYLGLYKTAEEAAAVYEEAARKEFGEFYRKT